MYTRVYIYIYLYVYVCIYIYDGACVLGWYLAMQEWKKDINA